MRRISDDEVHWTTRITIRDDVRETVRSGARDEMRSVACMIGSILRDWATARSSG